MPALADEIFGLSAEHHEEAGVASTTFALVYEDESRNAITTHTYSCRRDVDALALDGSKVAASLDGTPIAQVQQAQRHTEALTRSYLMAHQAQIQQLLTLNERFAERILVSEHRAQAAQDTVYRIREELATAENAKEETEVRTIQKRALDLAEMFLKVQLTKAGGPPR